MKAELNLNERRVAEGTNIDFPKITSISGIINDIWERIRGKDGALDDDILNY